MQNSDHTTPGMIELTDAELDSIVGGNWLGDAFRAIGSAIVHAVEWVGGIIAGGLQGPRQFARPVRSGFGTGPAALLISSVPEDTAKVGGRLDWRPL